MTDMGTTLWGCEFCLKITLLPSLQPNKVCSGLVLWKMPRGCLCALACLGKNSFLPLLNPLMLCSLFLGVCLTQAVWTCFILPLHRRCGAGEDSWEFLGLQKVKRANPKGNQLWIFIGRIVPKAEAPVLWLPDAESQLIRKDPDAGKDWRQNEKGSEDEVVR